MFDAYKKGSTKFAGNEDPILIAAKEDGKTFASPKEIQDYANEPGVKERATEIAQGIRIKRLLAAGKTPEELQEGKLGIKLIKESDVSGQDAETLGVVLWNASIKGKLPKELRFSTSLKSKSPITLIFLPPNLFILETTFKL
jgi:hypothetical protein